MNDKEGRKWLLQKLYDNGIRYIAFSPFYGGYVGVKETPRISEKGEVFNEIATVITLCDIVPDFNKPNWLDIGEYLGIVDWEKVAVDTPVKARVYNRTGALVWRNYHFAKYQKGNVYCWADGLTSWGADNLDVGNPRTVIHFGVRLAGGSDEN